MSREINWNEPLSDEDRAYAEMRGWDDRIADNDARFGNEKADKGMSRDQRMEKLRAEIAERTNELDRLTLEAEQEANANRSIAGDPRTGNLIVDNTGVDGEAPEGAPAEAKRYDDMSSDKLKAEIRKRNKEREAEDLDPLPTSGTKAELVERLLADDREIAESQA